MEESQVEIVPTCGVHRETVTFHEQIECYNVTDEEQQE
jgi:hypothetical protein